MKEVERRMKIAYPFSSYQITEYLESSAPCGETSFAGASKYEVKTNLGWLMAEAARLKAKGIRTVICWHGRTFALYRQPFAMTPDEFRARVAAAWKEIDGKGKGE